MQWHHYRACMDIFTLKPSNDSREFADLLGFLAQVSRASYSLGGSLYGTLLGPSATLQP